MGQVASVGAVVHYTPDPELGCKEGESLAAIVALVYPDGETVNLAVFDTSGFACAEPSVPFSALAPGSGEAAGCWGWPVHVPTKP